MGKNKQFFIFKVNSKKVLLVLVILISIFIVKNIYTYNVYTIRYVSVAQPYLLEARKEFVNALMFHNVYQFFVESVGIDFQSPILYPIKAPRDYFYYKGLTKLSKKEAERAYWFNKFEVSLYKLSINGKIGSMARNYGKEFSKKFMDKVYTSIELMSLQPIQGFDTPYIRKTALGSYLYLIILYTYDYHQNPKGAMLNKENLETISTNSELHKRFSNIYTWQNKVLEFYKKNDLEQYNLVLDPISYGWYSPYRKVNNNLLVILSYIEFYRIHNGLFTCQSDQTYLNSIELSKNKLFALIDSNKKYSKEKVKLNKLISYLHITNIADKNDSIISIKGTSKNPN